MIATSGINAVQLAANIVYLTAAGYGLYRLIDRAFGKKMQEHVTPVMRALTDHMAEEEDGMKALVKGQKKIGRQFDAHAKSDVEQFEAVRKSLAEIQTHRE